MRLSSILLLSALGATIDSLEDHPIISRHLEWIVGQTVHTQSGPIGGRGASSATQVSTYLGIPYAKSPIGNLRFAPPERFESSTPISGSKFGYSCPTTTVFGGGAPANFTNKNLTTTGYAAYNSLLQVNDTFSEDCLTLNIWTNPQVGERKKAVMVWIYGGGYNTGTSSDPVSDGQYIADQEDVVVVSFNYRTNIFGFPGVSNSLANFGLMDQRLAIEWIRDNIASFGGDPSRITLFGQSAGAGSIDLYSYAYLSDPIISGMILQSGTTGLGVYQPEDTAAGWYNVTSTLGCGDNSTSSDMLLACMRSKSQEEITKAIPTSNSPFGAAAFWPTIDERLVFSNYTNRSSVSIPLLIGTTNYEAGYHKVMSSLFDASELPDEQWDGFNNMIFNCPAAKRAAESVEQGRPTWRYRYFGKFSDMSLTTDGRDGGAYHGSELAVLFGTTGGGEDESVGRYMRGAWAAFAKDSVKGLRKYGGGWPKYQPGEKTMARLAVNNKAGIDLVEPEVYDSSC